MSDVFVAAAGIRELHREITALRARLAATERQRDTLRGEVMELHDRLAAAEAATAEIGDQRDSNLALLLACRTSLAAAEKERDQALELFNNPGSMYPRLIAAEAERDAALAEVKALRQALQFYADENRYDYDAPCCPTPNNPGHKIADGDVISDDGERAREALYGPVAAKERP